MILGLIWSLTSCLMVSDYQGCVTLHHQLHNHKTDQIWWDFWNSCTKEQMFMASPWICLFAKNSPIVIKRIYKQYFKTICNDTVRWKLCLKARFQWNLFMFYVYRQECKVKRKENFIDVFVQRSPINFFTLQKRAFEIKLFSSKKIIKICRKQ